MITIVQKGRPFFLDFNECKQDKKDEMIAN